MGFISSMLNPSQGAGFQAQGYNVLSPTTSDQATRSYGESVNAYNQQQAFVNALQGQNGLANQSNVFNQQQGLADQLGAQARGEGPNPALAQLAMSTGQNTANQAALMAGQRGTGSNAGLIARQAAMQGGANEQNAAGQAAVMRAQQQLAAQGALQQQQSMMGGMANQQVANQQSGIGTLNQAAQGQYQNVLNALNQQNNSNISNVQGVNSANASIAQGNQKGQWGILGGLTSAAGTAAGMPGGGAPKAHGGMIHYADGGDVAPTPPPMLSQGDSSGGGGGDMMSTIMKVAPMLMADGGSVGPKSWVGKFMNGVGTGMGTSMPGAPTVNAQGQKSYSQDEAGSGYQMGEGIGQGLGALAGAFSSKNPMSGAKNITPSGYAGADPSEMSRIGAAHGGKVPAILSPGEKYLAPKDVKKVENGKNPIELGEKIPGKAKVKGDSLKNDVVRRNLDSGGIVIPRSVMQSKDPSSEAAKFVAAILAREKMGKR